MDFVDNIHSLAHRGRGEHRFLPERAHIVNAVVGRRVELHNIEHRAVAYPSACGAHSAGIAVHRMLAVDSLGEDPCAGRLAGAARADEEIGMGKPARPDLIFQRLGNMLLTDDLIEGLRTPLAIQSLIHAPPPLRHIMQLWLLTRLHTRHRTMNYVRYPGSRLGPGKLAAHEKHRLMLLGSPPDMVRGFPLRETGSSTLLTGVRRHRTYPQSGIRPCCSGLQVTGHRWLPD